MDSKDIKDYLHLYLGCDTDKGKLIGIELNKAICMMDDLSIVEGNIYNLKPILRPLSDMDRTEEMLLGLSGSKWGPYTSVDIIILLKEGFDLFGLIDSGLAIKKSS